ncbi:MAG TPA: hypothetical protein DEW46_13460 [Verrucomicrobia bacterium]|jgi:hypothetical protein|nr:hypothetical protein [Verrucomicrobiota bacterium]
MNASLKFHKRWLHHDKVGIALGILALAAIRMVGTVRLPIVVDEFFSWNLIQGSFSDIVRNTAKDVHPPLYYILLKLWAEAFGYSIRTLRVLSVILNILTVLVMLCGVRHLLAKRPKGKSTSIAWSFWVLVLLSNHCLLIVPTIYVRMYSLGALLSALSALFFVRIVDQNKPAASNLMGLGCSLGLLMLTHNFGIFTAISELATILIIACNRSVSKVEFARIITSLLLPIIFIYGWWIPSLLFQTLETTEHYWIGSLSPDLFFVLAYRFILGFSPEGISYFSAATLILALALFSGWSYKEGGSIVLLWVVALTPLLLSQIWEFSIGTPILVERYLCFSVVILIVLGGYLFSIDLHSYPRLLLMALISFAMTTDTWSYFTLEWDHDGPGRVIAKEILDIPSDKATIVCHLEANQYLETKYWLSMHSDKFRCLYFYLGTSAAGHQPLFSGFDDSEMIQKINSAIQNDNEVFLLSSGSPSDALQESVRYFKISEIPFHDLPHFWFGRIEELAEIPSCQ